MLLIVGCVIFIVVVTLLQRHFFPDLTKPDSEPYQPIGKQRSPAGRNDPDIADPLKKTAEFRILPGEGIGPFRLNTTWDQIDSQLVEVYEEIPKRGIITIMAKPLTFDVGSKSRTVVAMTAWTGFEGALAGRIRIGHRLALVKRVLGCRVIPLRDRNEARLEGIAGVALLIEGGWYDGWKSEAALRHEIGAIRIFLPENDWLPESYTERI